MSVLYSMTGYSNVHSEYNSNEISCEIRTVNSRYLEIFIKLPKAIADIENSIKEIIRNKISRGKISYSLSFSSLSSELQNLKIDSDTVRLYRRLLDQISEAAGISDPVKLDHLLFFKDIISFEEESAADEKLLAAIKQVTEQAMDQLNEMRAREGANLLADLLERLDRIDRLTAEIAELGKENPRREFEKLYKRLISLLSEEKIDRDRLEQELALLSDKVDITEETVRMRSHLQLFRDYLDHGSPIGKKLNFLLQEMHREVNTMSSKATLIEISHRVVTIKEEIEKLREQIQNIE